MEFLIKRKLIGHIRVYADERIGKVELSIPVDVGGRLWAGSIPEVAKVLALWREPQRVHLARSVITLMLFASITESQLGHVNLMIGYWI